MKLTNRFNKRVMAGIAAVLMVMGMTSQSAQAVTWGQGDLVLAIYGNTTAGVGQEALINLSQLSQQGGGVPIGSMDNLAAHPSTVYTFDVASFLNAAGVLGNPTKYTIMAFESNPLDSSTPYIVGSSSSAATLGVQLQDGNFINSFNQWAGNINDTNAPRNVDSSINGSTLSFSNALSMTGVMGNADKLSGAFNKPMMSTLGNLLNLIAGEPNNCFGCAVSPAGQALLSANGTFQISGGQLAAVPVPAALVLFGTGIIGIVGIARRKIFGKMA